MVNEFTDWLIEKMGDMSMRELARRSGGAVSHSTISLVLSGKLEPSADFCVGVARGLGLPADVVLRKAGHVGPREGDTEHLTLREVWQILLGLDERQLKEVRRYARYVRDTEDSEQSGG